MMGAVRLAWAKLMWQVAGDENDARPVPRFPLSGGDHRPRCLALPLLQLEPARGRADPRPAWHRGEHESIRAWGLRFGRAFATALKRRRPRPGGKWYLDEVVILSAKSGGWGKGG